MLRLVASDELSDGGDDFGKRIMRMRKIFYMIIRWMMMKLMDRISSANSRKLMTSCLVETRYLPDYHDDNDDTYRYP